MIYGIVTPDQEATITLEVQDAQGGSVTVLAVVDTGFNGSLSSPRRSDKPSLYCSRALETCSWPTEARSAWTSIAAR